MFTSLLGTTITFTICLPSSVAFILASANALSRTTFSGASADTTTRAAQLAVDLHRDFDFFFFGQRRIVLRPGSTQQTSLFAQHFPEFVSQVGSEGSEQQGEGALDLEQQRSRDQTRGRGHPRHAGFATRPSTA